ncbi:hypothetical protein ACIRRA_29390 [Nocardia sp. NPDC101769]|uniref:hypothetical protein n=1 Tax=Nocardia sp. NPDC101769 TaxID=3364333 RepID=UPI00382736DA
MPVGRSPRIQVTGRARAGKTALRHALSLLTAEETRPVDRPGQPDPAFDADLVLYVLPGLADHADRRLLATVHPDRTLVVLNKADAIGARWPDAAAAADDLTAEFGLLVFPVVASLAAHTRSGTLTDADLRTLHRHRDRPDPALTLSHDLFTAPDLAPDPESRQALLDRWDLFGVSCALAALRRHPTLPPQLLLQILHCASGIDPLHHELHRRYEAVAAVFGD